ncbi:amidohydrolase family protein [Frankia sp. CNm7]|uniref:Amidohydrolase family protein n=1 Tax=Frankia nepalensis TaxID=1836974 RepID=A0A937UKB5_9ACTN|nr:amidohydrolase family protein [Frankia nepalensis]MBL7496787.1 amidohydrolase family protein [Frankia nepalensis]MBL7511560.1 amidohydrolase family protein [Frankia nepalensis]MBL7518922.1 amidohydrolase family protein [Frankia nepalensis]MBL7626654.1 amidohydrolase family protein [Frankia nepalensis]
MTAGGSAREVRESLGHVVIDADAHHVEISVAFADFVHDHGGGRLLDDPAVRAVGLADGSGERVPSLAERRRLHLSARPVWWTPNDTLDYATVAMPSLYHERLGEAGIDFAVVYPSRGMVLLGMEDTDTRVGLTRLYNEYVAAAYRPYRDRLAPVALIPAHTPDEGIAALEHAVSLGLRAALMPSFVWRPIPAFADAPPEYRSRLQRIDNFGLDSDHDYDPFWAKAVELDVPLSCHSSGFRLNGHFSPSNYSYAAGHFAAVGEATAKSLFLGGVLTRFPELRIALLEGGVAGGVRVLGDLVSRFEKRGADGLGRLDPARLDPAELARLAARHAPELTRYRPEQLVPGVSAVDGQVDDFARAGVGSVEDIRDAFCRGFYWGCEGDDPLVGLAYDTRVNPPGARLRPMMGSDLGHWDVPSFTHPLREAYELVEDGILTPAQFEEFTCANAVRFYGGRSTAFFAGTAVAADAERVQAADRVQATDQAAGGGMAGTRELEYTP